MTGAVGEDARPQAKLGKRSAYEEGRGFPSNTYVFYYLLTFHFNMLKSNVELSQHIDSILS